MDNGKPKVTIYDIARISGSSPSTVSAALSKNWRERRIREATALRIRQIAADHGYTANLQARGLRRGRSGLVGLILPLHENRFFSSLSQCFESEARKRGWCPVIVSTLRDGPEEIRTVETLISYAVDYLFICGATDPDTLSELCQAAKLLHIYIDLPGERAPSVVSDNFHGSQMLTRTLLGHMPDAADAAADGMRDRLYFVGGLSTDYASAQRILAFRKTLEETKRPFDESQIVLCGYSPERVEQSVATLCERLGHLPAGLFVNSITALEGVVRHFVHLPSEAFDASVIGCYDYDPFAAFLRFPVHMIRQNSNGLIASAFEIFDSGVRDPVLIQVEPELVPPRTVYGTNA